MSEFLTWEVQRLSGSVWLTAEGETIAVCPYDHPQDVARRVLVECLRELADEDTDQRRALVWRGRHPFGDSYMATEHDLLADPS
ncbi:hypothetical protein ACIRQY_34665, partial [Streptomyces sp. NPDC101490]|uniref:hypothetical protein n=1 Tax=Streptomyces sp. NPDC101490 TaxID=3366143 RepID=UPI0037F7D824